ncbi:TPA: transcriptional regulator [Vibrio vulnificus]
MCIFNLTNNSINIEFNANQRLIYNLEDYCENGERLTAVEADLLELLVKNRTVTRGECEAILWQERVVSDPSRSLNQAVSTLRKKLDNCGGQDLLLTKPRVGYFIADTWFVKKLSDQRTESANIHLSSQKGVKQKLDAFKPEWSSNYGLGQYFVLVFSLLLILVTFVYQIHGVEKYAHVSTRGYASPSLKNIININSQEDGEGYLGIRDQMIGESDELIYFACRKEHEWVNFSVFDYVLEMVGDRDVKEIRRICMPK